MRNFIYSIIFGLCFLTPKILLSQITVSKTNKTITLDLNTTVKNFEMPITSGSYNLIILIHEFNIETIALN